MSQRKANNKLIYMEPDYIVRSSGRVYIMSSATADYATQTELAGYYISYQKIALVIMKLMGAVSKL